MGSSGSGAFGTYNIGNNLDGSIGGNSGKKVEVECPKEIENIRLEDVATSEYYLKRNLLPTVNSKVQLRNEVHYGRLVIETFDTNEVIGNIPTRYNYLLNCIKQGIVYTGRVISSGSSPIPFVVVTLNA